MSFSTRKVPGNDAVRILHEYRAAFAPGGQYPFLIGTDFELTRLVERARSKSTPSQILEASVGLDLSAQIEYEREIALEDEEFDLDELLGEWPGDEPEKGAISLHLDTQGQPYPEMYLGLAAVEQSWQLPAAVQFGNWNACPKPELHCAFHRDWQARFGAEITGISHDVIECTVARPPRDRAAALELAWEQYWYAPDIVSQGCGYVAHLAATLLNSPYWFFWWD